MVHTHALPFCKLAVHPTLHRVLLQTQCTEHPGPWVSVIELPSGVVHDNDLPVSVLRVCMASENFVDGHFFFVSARCLSAGRT